MVRGLSRWRKEKHEIKKVLKNMRRLESKAKHKNGEKEALKNRNCEGMEEVGQKSNKGQK